MGTHSRLGREIYRGIFSYIRTHTRWRLAIDTSNNPSRTSLPQCDAYIAALWTDALVAWADGLRTKLMVNVSSRRDTPQHLQVRVDDAVVGALAATHLLDRSMRRFGFVGPPDEPQAESRCAGFTNELHRCGYACDRFDWQRDASGSLRWQGLLDWLKARECPIAIFCSNDDTGRLVTQACWEVGLAVPERVAVLGVDNDEVFCEASQPALSSVEIGAMRIGFEAARYIDDALKGTQPSPRDLRLLPVNVQERASTDIVAIDDPDLAATLRFIREHACDGISVDDVLEVTGLNRRLLERRFKAQLGHSPLEHIHRVRLRRAHDLLSNTTLPLKQVAEKSGFTYLQTFHRAFAQHFGTTPGEVRKASRLRS